LKFSRGKKDETSVKTQHIFSFVDFGHVYWIESVHHHALIQDKWQVLCNEVSTYGIFVVFFVG